MEEIKEMPFGKKFRVGNFEYVKIVKSLSKREMKALRDAQNIPVDVRKHLNRSGLPYIVVSTISGSWSICFVCGSTMYGLIEYEYGRGEEGENALINLFVMMYSDTAVAGDSEYWKAKAEALQAFMDRKKSVVSEEDDEKEIEALRAEHEAREAIISMAKEVENG